MSKKLEIKNALASLQINRSFKLASSSPQFQAPTPLGKGDQSPSEIPLDESKTGFSAQLEVAAPIPFTAALSSNTEETLSKMDSIQIEHCPKQTVSNADSVQNGQCAARTVSNLDSSQDEQCLNQTVSKIDSVQDEHCPELTVSNLDTVEGPAKRLSGGFTAVPHSLLRGDAKFSEPLDFMIFMHLYSYSYGFSRTTATMSQTQLETFTGAAKNTVKRALERLTKKGWIKCVEEYERSRMSRKWRVSDLSTRTVSKIDTVQNEQYPKQTLTVSKMDPVTLSNLDTHKERIHKEKSNNSLSGVFLEGEISSELKKYFENLKPEKKKRSELQSFHELRNQFQEAQITECLSYLLKLGTPGTHEPCHSPMAYLSRAMADVQKAISTARESEQTLQAKADKLHQQTMQNATREAQEEAQFRQMEQAFLSEFSSPEEQDSAIERFFVKIPGFSPNPQAARALAISKWWSQRKDI